jgi:hypothetical protein
VTKFLLKGRKLSLSILDGSFFPSDTLETFSFFLGGFKFLLLNFKLHLKPHLGFSFLCLLSGLLIIMLCIDLVIQGLHLNLVLILHFLTITLLLKTLFLHLVVELLHLLFSFCLLSFAFLLFALSFTFVVVIQFLVHGELVSDRVFGRVLDQSIFSTVLITEQETTASTKDNSIVGLQNDRLHVFELLTVDEYEGYCAFTQWLENCLLVIGFERSMLVLHSDTTEDQGWVFRRVVLFATDSSFCDLRKIKEDLPVEHAVLIQIHELWAT